MTISEYQDFASKGILKQTLEISPVVGFALGLAGEAGEVVDDVKKRIFHGRHIPISHTKEELGDVMWYVANLATVHGLDLQEIIDENVSKLKSRYEGEYLKEVLQNENGTNG